MTTTLTRQPQKAAVISQRPLSKVPSLCDAELRHYEARCPQGCGTPIIAQWQAWDGYTERQPADYDPYVVWDDTSPDGSAGGWTAQTLAEAQGYARDLLLEHLAVCAAVVIPKQIPKTSDMGDCRFYDWTCDQCGTHWSGNYYSPAAYDSDCSEPYTLTQDGRECGRYSYETAAQMHADFAEAVGSHDCQPQADDDDAADDEAGINLDEIALKGSQWRKLLRLAGMDDSDLAADIPATDDVLAAAREMLAQNEDEAASKADCLECGTAIQPDADGMVYLYCETCGNHLGRTGRDAIPADEIAEWMATGLPMEQSKPQPQPQSQSQSSQQAGLDGDTLAIILEMTATQAGTDINCDYLTDTLGDDTPAKASAIAYCAQHGISLAEPWTDANGRVMPPVVRGWSKLRIDDDTLLEVSHIAANIGTRRGEILAMSLIVSQEAEGYLTEASLAKGGSIEAADWLYANISEVASYDLQLLSDWLGCQIPQDWGLLPAISHHNLYDLLPDWRRGKLSARLTQPDGTITNWQHSLAEVAVHLDLSSVEALGEFAQRKADEVVSQFGGHCHILITHPRCVGMCLVSRQADRKIPDRKEGTNN